MCTYMHTIHTIIQAKLAGVISEKQFGLAVALGDPMMGCRSKVYLALSLMQQGQYRKAGKIIRYRLPYLYVYIVMSLFAVTISLKTTF